MSLGHGGRAPSRVPATHEPGNKFGAIKLADATHPVASAHPSR